MAEVPRLRVVDGEVGEDAPSYAELVTLNRKLENELNGKRLRIAALELDRDAWAAEHPLRPEIQAVAACWRRATGRRREIDATDVEQIARALYVRNGFRLALTAVAGAAYDPATTVRRNGTKVRFDDLELIFRNAGKRADFVARAPKGWQPDAERVAEIVGREVEWVTERLRDGWRAPKDAPARRAA